MKKQALRYNTDKLQWSLVDFKSLEDMVKVLEFGAKKYEANNWKKGFPVTKLCDSLLRHVVAYLNGEDVDPESGISHIGHIQCNAMFLARMQHIEKWDDRWKDKRKKVKNKKQ